MSKTVEVDRGDNLPVRADSRIPNGFTKLKNASTLLVFAVNSTITLCSLTSTIFAPNCEDSVEMECRCWCFRRRACDGVNGTPAAGNASGCAPRSKLCARVVSRSSFEFSDSSASISALRRGSCEGPPVSCSSRYSGPRMDTLTRRSSRVIVRVSV